MKNTENYLALARWFKGGQGFSQNQVIDKIGRQTRPVQQGRAYNFNITDDRLVIPDNVLMYFNQNWTFHWFREHTGTFQVGGFIKRISGGNNMEFSIGQYSPNGGVSERLYLYFSSNGGSWASAYETPNLTTLLNQTVHYAFQRNGNDFTLWRNGVQVGSFTNSANVFNGSADWVFGTSADSAVASSGNHWNIAFHNASLFTGAFNPFGKQFENVYRNGLVALYKCDEGGGTLAIDSSGNNIDGVLVNIDLNTFHSTLTNGQGADWQNQFGSTPNIRFNGTTGTSGINLGNSANANFLQHNTFTIHCRFVCNNVSGNNVIFANNAGVNANGLFRVYISGGQLVINIDNFTNTFVQNGILDDTEYHLAIVREGIGTNETKVYLNGTQFGTSFTWSNTTLLTNNVRIGQDNQNTSSLSFVGWIRNFCVSTQTIWTNTFTVPTTWIEYQNLQNIFTHKYCIYNLQHTYNPFNLPMTASADTHSHFVPRNESNITFDAYGEPLFYRNRVKYNAELRQSNALTFDSIDSFVSLPINTDIQFGGANFEVEIDFIVTSLAGDPKNLIWYGNDGNFFGGFNITVVTDGSISASVGFDNSSSLLSIGSVAGVIQTNVYYNVKYRRVGNNFSLLLHNVVVATGTSTNSVAIPNTGATAQIGAIYGATFRRWYFAGQIFGLKITHSGTNTAWYPMAEGRGAFIYSRINNRIASFNGFDLSTCWNIRQDEVHYNLLNGYEEYSDGSNIIRVPLSLTNTSLGHTIGGFTSQGIRRAGTWHNGAETTFVTPLAPQLIRRDTFGRLYNLGTQIVQTFANMHNVSGTKIIRGFQKATPFLHKFDLSIKRFFN